MIRKAKKMIEVLWNQKNFVPLHSQKRNNNIAEWSSW